MNDRISVVGLGKLGSCMLASFAHAGYPVVGSDLNEEVISKLNEGEPPFPEPHLGEYLNKSKKGNLSTTTDNEEAVRETDITFIVVNTYGASDSQYSLEQVNSVCETIGRTLREKNDYHLVVLTSTVFPGTTAGKVRDRLERVSGKVAGDDFGLCYSPEFIAIGDIIEGLENPDFFLIGEHTERSGDILSDIYRSWNKTAPIVRMSPTEAEITKMAVNSYVTMKISFANMIGAVCDEFDVRVDVVTDALTSDSRISDNYFTAGCRYGGPCFPRDNVAFSKLVEGANLKPSLPLATDEMNSQYTRWLADIIRDETQRQGTIAILGLTYKPDTYIVEESQGMELVHELDDQYELVAYDPGGARHAKRVYGSDLTMADSMEEALEHADTAVVTVQWDEFTDYERYEGASVTLIDPWRLLNGRELPPTIDHRPIGQ